MTASGRVIFQPLQHGREGAEWHFGFFFERPE
jgi:hypothetical protein